MLAAEHDDSELVCESLRYVEPVQLGVQQPRQAPVELVGTGKDAGSSVEHCWQVGSLSCHITTEHIANNVLSVCWSCFFSSGNSVSNRAN